MAIYLRTLAPGLSWANGGTDGGDLIAAAATGGIAHPTGYPLYLLLARFFQFVPIGSLAYRTNLMSAVCTALTALLIYSLVARSISSQQSIDKTLPALTAGYAFGLAPLIWSQAVITEVYALQSFLIALIVHLISVPLSGFHPNSNRVDYLRGLSLGLAISNHVTAALLLPMALALGSLRSQERPVAESREAGWPFDWAALRRQLLGLALGLSPYLTLPFRALAHPPVNWGYPVTFRNFWWLVTGQLYQSYYLRFSLPDLWGHVQAGASLLFQQFGPVGVMIGILGLVLFGSRSRLYALTGWIAITSAAFAFFYGAEDSYLYLIPVFLGFAIWIGLGTAGIMHRFAEQTFLLRFTLGILAVSYILLRSAAIIGDVDASRDLEAESFGREILSTAPANAILFAEGDRAVFALWYFHFALKERPDLIVIAEDLLHFDWYQETLQKTYPSLVVSGPFPWPETMAMANPLHAVCYARYSDLTELECSGPLSPP